MTVAAPTASSPALRLLSSVGRGFRRERTLITQGDVIRVASPAESVVDVRDQLRQRAALEWAAEVMEPLRSLPPNWDSYGAEPLNSSVVGLGTSLLAALALKEVDPPETFPTADGGLSLEWHRVDLDFV